VELTAKTLCVQYLAKYKYTRVCCLLIACVYESRGLVVGFGVEQLCDGSLDTYWQSDGPQPHLINVQFRRKMTITNICIYADYKADESYTPNR